MPQKAEIKSYIVSLVKVPQPNQSGKMRQSLKIMTNQGDKWLNLTEEPWLSPTLRGQSASFEVWVYNGKLYGKLAQKAPTAGMPSGIPAPQGQPVPQAPKAPVADQFDREKETRLSIERQTAIKAACEFYSGLAENPQADVSDEAILGFAQKIAYFIATGFNQADTEQIKAEKAQLEGELAEPPQGDDEPPPQDNDVPAF